MAIQDTLAATIKASIAGTLARTQSDGCITGQDVLSREISKTITDGTGIDQASGWFCSTFDATLAGVTINLASLDPLGGAGDDAPSSSPEGLKLRAIMIENTDDTNFITVSLGPNVLTGWLGGTNPTITIRPGGFEFAFFPPGLTALSEGVNDEIIITADTAEVPVDFSYLFG